MNKVMQSEFCHIPELPRGNVDHMLYYKAEELRLKQLLEPDFQRPFVWTSSKITGWGKSIVNQQGIGVIVTYQLKGGGPIFLADGFQRLTAANLFMDAPQDYGFSFGPEQARIYCKSFPITVQHRIYSSHAEAMAAFHNLNKGTILNPQQYYNGILTLDKLGNVIAKELPSIVFSYEKPIVTAVAGMVDNSKFTRDTYALFLQYITKTTQLDFWGVSRSKISDEIEQSVEYRLVSYMQNDGWSMDQLRGKILYFDRYIAERTAEIRSTISDIGQTGKPMSRTMMRWLLHLAIWRKNSNKPDALYLQFLNRMLSACSNYPTFTSRFPVTIKDGKGEYEKMVSLQSGVLKDLKMLCSAFDIPLHEGFKRTKKKAAPGYHNSHIVPLSKYGEGETFFESGPRNRSRGAQAVLIESEG